MKDFNFTHEEFAKITHAMRKSQFRHLLTNYVDEISNEQHKEEQEQYMLQLEEQGEVPKGCVLVKPEVGCCVKADLVHVTGLHQKCFLNICHSPWIVDLEVVKKAEGISVKLPFSVCPPRPDKDRKGLSCLTIDVCVSTRTYEECRNFQVLPHLKCKGGKPALASLREDLVKDKKRFHMHREREIEKRRQFRTVQESAAITPKGLKKLIKKAKVKTQVVAQSQTPEVLPAVDSNLEEKECSVTLDSATDLDEVGRRSLIRYEQKKAPNTSLKPGESRIVHQGYVKLSELFGTNSTLPIHKTIPDNLQVEANLGSSVQSAKEVDVSISEDQRRLSLRKIGGCRDEVLTDLMAVSLPFPVDFDKGSAQFDISNNHIRLLLPVDKIALQAQRSQDVVLSQERIEQRQQHGHLTKSITAAKQISHRNTPEATVDQHTTATEQGELPTKLQQEARQNDGYVDFAGQSQVHIYDHQCKAQERARSPIQGDSDFHHQSSTVQSEFEEASLGAHTIECIGKDKNSEKKLDTELPLHREKLTKNDEQDSEKKQTSHVLFKQSQTSMAGCASPPSAKSSTLGSSCEEVGNSQSLHTCEQREDLYIADQGAKTECQQCRLDVQLQMPRSRPCSGDLNNIHPFRKPGVKEACKFTGNDVFQQSVSSKETANRHRQASLQPSRQNSMLFVQEAVGPAVHLLESRDFASAADDLSVFSQASKCHSSLDPLPDPKPNTAFLRDSPSCHPPSASTEETQYKNDILSISRSADGIQAEAASTSLTKAVLGEGLIRAGSEFAQSASCAKKPLWEASGTTLENADVNSKVCHLQRLGCLLTNQRGIEEAQGESSIKTLDSLTDTVADAEAPMTPPQTMNDGKGCLPDANAYSTTPLPRHTCSIISESSHPREQQSLSFDEAGGVKQRAMTTMGHLLRLHSQLWREIV